MLIGNHNRVDCTFGCSIHCGLRTVSLFPCLNKDNLFNRAKNIKNKPKINEDPKDAMLREYQEEIQKLKSMLEGKDGDVAGRKMLSGKCFS